MKNRNEKIILGVCIVFLGAIFSRTLPIQNTAYAQPSTGLYSEYHPLAPLPDNFFPGDAKTKYDLPNYLAGMFKILLAVAGLLAVIMIVIGGIEYMSTDAISGKSEGKEKISNAILGLLLALVSWLLLYTINPELLKFNFNATNPSAPKNNGILQQVDSPVQNQNTNPNTLPPTNMYDNPNGTGSSVQS